MKRTILVIVSILLVSMLVGCGNASATSQQINVAPEKSSNDYEAPTTAPVEESSKENINVQTTSREEGIVTVDQPDINWQDYIDSDGAFNMDDYAEALGYTVIKADDETSWYIADTIHTHYCIVASGSINVLIDCDDGTSYAINYMDNSSNSYTEAVHIQDYTAKSSPEWIDEISSLLKFIIKSGPSSEGEMHYYPGIKTAEVMCTKWSENFVVDERGVALDSRGSAELLWKVNYPN